MQRIYLDNNATTRPDPAVVAAMAPYLTEHWGNPGSGHGLGTAPREALAAARADVARCLGVAPGEVVFTGGGTESDVTAVVGVARRRRRETGARRVLISAVEHPAVTAAVAWLETDGFTGERLAVGPDGRLAVDALDGQDWGDVALLSVMLANNETGAVLPVAALAAAARAAGVPVHCDAVNAAGKIAVDVPALGVDLLSLSAHKFHGPRGVGVLVVGDGVGLDPLIPGGGQEHGLRSGTEDVAGIVGLGLALRLATDGLTANAARMQVLRDRLHDGLRALESDLILNGPAVERLPNTLNVSLPGADGAALAAALDARGVAISTGAACHDTDHVGSPVLAAMGVDVVRARGALRISLSRETSEAEVDAALAAFAEVLA